MMIRFLILLFLFAGTATAQSDQAPIDLKATDGVITVDTSKALVPSEKFEKEPIKLDGELVYEQEGRR